MSHHEDHRYVAATTLITAVLAWFLDKRPVIVETKQLFLAAMHAALVIFSMCWQL